MTISQEQYEQMMDYFEGRLPAEDEIGFLEAVAADENWRKEFEWEMILRHGQTEDQENSQGQYSLGEFAPADTYLREVQSAVEGANTSEPPQKPPRIIPYKRLYGLAAMLLIALGLAIAAFFYYRQENTEMVKSVPPQIIDSIAQKPGITPPIKRNEEPLVEKTADGKTLYQQYYRRYIATEEDPVEVSKYFYAYESGNYKSVITASNHELGTKGGNDDSTSLKNYLLFYQGISYLQLNDSPTAIAKFEQLLGQPGLQGVIKENTLWYLSLAHLSLDDFSAAKRTLKQLASGRSVTRYRQKAMVILKQLP